MAKWNFFTFKDKYGKMIDHYVRASDKAEAITKAQARWPDVDPKSCRIYHGVL